MASGIAAFYCHLISSNWNAPFFPQQQPLESLEYYVLRLDFPASDYCNLVQVSRSEFVFQNYTNFYRILISD